MREDPFRHLQGETQKISAHTPLLLDDPLSVWVIRSGEIAVFSVRLGEGKRLGARRYHFSLGAGHALFGAPTSAEGPYGFLAVPLVETEVTRVPAAEFEGWARESTCDVAKLVDAWLERLGDGDEGAQTPPGGGPRDGGILTLLHARQMACLRSLERRREQEAEQSRERLRKRAELHAQAMRGVVGMLAASAQLKEAPASPFDGDSLLMAARAVMDASGIPISSHVSIEPGDAEQVISAVERIWRVRSRRVLLTEGWWKSDCQALLAFRLEGNRAVALIPRSPTRYVLFDPASNTKVPITRSVAMSLNPTAYTFYRPLPAGLVDPIGVLRFGLRGTLRGALRWWGPQ